MTHLLQSLRDRARHLHEGVRRGDADALARARRLPEIARAGEDRTVRTATLPRHCRAVVAREIGFAGWSHAAGVLSGRRDKDFGTLLLPGNCEHLDCAWAETYDEALAIRARTDGYLLAWRTQYLVVDRKFVAALGLDPDDSDWERIGRDWVRPHDVEARERLYARLIAAGAGAVATAP